MPVRTLILLTAFATLCAAEFDPPRVIVVINAVDSGSVADSLLADRRYYIDKGLGNGISRGHILNVYREKRPSRRISEPLRLFIGTMTITESQMASSIGAFAPHQVLRCTPSDVAGCRQAVIACDGSVGRSVPSAPYVWNIGMG